MPEVNAVHVDRPLTDISLKYKNEALIGLQIMPIILVGKRSDKYWVYAKEDSYKAPDDTLGPMSMPNEMDWKTSTDNYSVKDYGLGEWVPQEAIDNADQPLAPLADASEILTDQLLLNEEIRIATKVFTAATYPVGNKVTLSGTSQWSGSADDPIKNVQDAVEACFYRANTLVFGIDAWLVFRRLPEVLDAVKAIAGTTLVGGMATPSAVANLFEVDRVLIGRARKGTNKEGQTATFGRVWGKHMSAHYIKPGSLNPKSLTFGGTFKEQQFLAYREFDGKRGVKGAHYVKVAHNGDEKVMASDLGYMIENAVA